ncbi:liver carboxylesterase 2-like [Chanos chanos]|uniref:Carboxylic ester hydrolase n=1 Tax=Chanos chanos TaxID=29144 RepID=A0A6J2WQI8_CHACN|nr:liver carboxylesterase 2-like [Chanos chanos]
MGGKSGLLVICITIVLKNLSASTATNAPVVQTKLGALEGEYMLVKGSATLVHSYLGVPFAKPPLGPLRLAPPEPVERWEGVKKATEQPPMCMQDVQLIRTLMSNLSFTMEVPDISEDCLYLNIYTPSKPGEDARLPVMVWIHGGGLTMGSASITDGSVLASYQNVVVVLIQYRLGMLGFLSTGDEHAPGNYGVLDQVAALRWVQEHIHNFGGDPNSVTIFGESAGGVSVSLQLLSPLSAGLFHRAIAQSGVALMDGVLNPNPYPMAQHVANTTGCDISSTKKVVECIKQWSTEDVVAFVSEPSNAMLTFGITVDGKFLPKPVKELMKNQEFQKMPLMTGVTNDEAGWLLLRHFAPPGWADGMDRDHVRPALEFYPDASETWIKELILDEYIGTSGDRIKIRDGFRELFADIMFNIPALKLANHHSEAAPVYFYELQHPPSIVQKTRPSFVGADHGDDLPFVFGACFANGHIKIIGQFTEAEDQLCRNVMSYWGNFARTGSPNGPGLTPWPEFGDEAEYLGIGLEQRPGKNLKGKRYLFMTKTIPEMVRVRKGREHTEL